MGLFVCRLRIAKDATCAQLKRVAEVLSLFEAEHKSERDGHATVSPAVLADLQAGELPKPFAIELDATLRQLAEARRRRGEEVDYPERWKIRTLREEMGAAWRRRDAVVYLGGMDGPDESVAALKAAVQGTVVEAVSVEPWRDEEERDE